MEEDHESKGTRHYYSRPYWISAIRTELQDLRSLRRGFNHALMKLVKDNGEGLEFYSGFKKKYGDPESTNNLMPLVNYIIDLRRVFRENLTRGWPIESKPEKAVKKKGKKNG
jgi:hypothetical protein